MFDPNEVNNAKSVKEERYRSDSQSETEPAVEQIGEPPEEVPFAIPEKWKWFTMRDITTRISDGSHNPPPDSTAGIPLLSAKNIQNGFIDFAASQRFVTEDQWKIENKKCQISVGDVLLTIVGTIGRAAVVVNAEKFMLQRSVCILKPKNYVYSRYLAMLLTSPEYIQWMQDRSAGTAQKGVYLKTIGVMPIPIPPLKEQHRIVSKLEEMFSLIDKAESSYQELTGPLMEQLRKSVLQLAIEGKLVPQLETEPDVEQIGEAPEEVPFVIPEKWKWVHLSKVGTVVGGGTPKSGVPDYWSKNVSDGIPWITPADLGKNNKQKFISTGSRSITQHGLKNSSAKMMPKGAIVYSSRAPIGHIAIAANDLCTNQGCKSLIPYSEVLSFEYAYFLLTARTPDIISRASGTTFAEISGKGMGETWIPLPPIEEQHRIVSKLDELLKEVTRI